MYVCETETNNIDNELTSLSIFVFHIAIAQTALVVNNSPLIHRHLHADIKPKYSTEEPYLVWEQ